MCVCVCVCVFVCIYLYICGVCLYVCIHEYPILIYSTNCVCYEIFYLKQQIVISLLWY